MHGVRARLRPGRAKTHRQAGPLMAALAMPA